MCTEKSRIEKNSQEEMTKSIFQTHNWNFFEFWTTFSLNFLNKRSNQQWETLFSFEYKPSAKLMTNDFSGKKMFSNKIHKDCHTNTVSLVTRQAYNESLISIKYVFNEKVST